VAASRRAVLVIITYTFGLIFNRRILRISFTPVYPKVSEIRTFRYLLVARYFTGRMLLMSPNQWRSNRVCSMDLRIGYFPSNRIWNRICGYDSNSNRISNRIRVVVYMFNADCPVGVVYLIMCKPTLLHTLNVLFFCLYCRSTCL